MKKGDLVYIEESELGVGIIVKSPYPSVITKALGGDLVKPLTISEETLVVDVMFSGKIHEKVKVELLKKVSEQIN